MPGQGFLPDNFAAQATGERVIEDVAMGYPDTVIGNVYMIDDQIREPGDVSREANNPDFSQNQLELYKEAHRRVVAAYQRKFEHAEHLPIECNDSTQDMIRVEQMMVIGLIKTGVSGALDDFKIEDVNEKSHDILKAIKEGKSAHQAVYDFFQGRNEEIARRMKECDETLAYNPGNLAQERLDSVRTSAEMLDRQRDIHNHLLLAFQGEIDPSMKANTIEDCPDDWIPFAHSMSVGNLVHFRRVEGKGTRIHAMINTGGTDKDHTNIVARASRIVVAKIKASFSRFFRHGDRVIIDGANGKIIASPARKKEDEYRLIAAQQREQHEKLVKKWRNTKWPKTKQGNRIKISANTGYSDEYEDINVINPGKIGLHRTELTILSREGAPTNEDKWHEIFCYLIDHAGGRPITIRSLDLIGDKMDKHLFRPTDTPEQKQTIIDEMLKAQLRGLLRARHDRGADNVHLMFPMIRTPEEFEALQDKVNAEAQDLGVESIHAGAMVETTKAIREMKRIKASFFSVGTNDLIAQLLSYERYGSNAEASYDPTDPDVLEALETIAEARPDLEISVCGDMATDPRYFALLIGCGFTHLSAALPRIPMIKELVSRIDENDAYELVQKFKRTEDPKERSRILDAFNEQKLGLLPNRLLASNDNPPELGSDEDLKVA